MFSQLPFGCAAGAAHAGAAAAALTPAHRCRIAAATDASVDQGLG
jgi:hypothetical protein